MKIQNVLLNIQKDDRGFTFVEIILYIAIIGIVLASLIPFAWNVIGAGAKNAVIEDVTSNARFISEKIKYEIRNASGITSVSSSQIVLTNTSASEDPTLITYIAPNVFLQKGTGAPRQLNADDVRVTGLTFTDYTTSDEKSKNISFILFVEQAYTGDRADFMYNTSIQGTAEVRSN